MENVSNWRDNVKEANPPIEDAAEAVIIKLEEGWIFVTHKGEIIGPDHDRETILTKAQLYLVSEKN